MPGPFDGWIISSPPSIPSADYMAEETYRGLNASLRALSLSRMCESRLRIARTWYGIDWTMPVW